MKQSPHKRDDKLLEGVPNWVYTDIVEAANWAQEELTNLEGAGHHIVVTACQQYPGFVRCSFSKSAWASDYSGPPGEDAAEAIVLAVQAYKAGQ